MFETLKTYSPIIVAICFLVFFTWIRHGKGGAIGKAIRRSDWLAWHDAVEEKERELAELRKVEPKKEDY